MGLSLSSVSHVDETSVPVDNNGKRKRRRGRGGLGRGLARILTDSGGPPVSRASRGSSGLAGLVGERTATSFGRFEASIIDAALGFLLDEFDLTALAVAVGPSGRAADPPLVRAVLPPSWQVSDGPGRLVHRELQATMTGTTSKRRRARYGPDHFEKIVEGQRFWCGRTSSDAAPYAEDVSSEAAGAKSGPQPGLNQGIAVSGRPVAVVAALGQSLGPNRSRALLDAVGSLVQSLIQPGADPALRRAIAEGTKVSLKSEGGDVLAEVNADWPIPTPSDRRSGARRTGVGRANEPIMAVARATAKACRPRCEVLFAGTAATEGGQATLAVIRRGRSGPRIGWALGRQGDLTGVSEAVFSAAL